MSTPDEYAALVSEWKENLERFREENKQLLMGMAAAGIRPEETSIMHARLDCLVECIAEAMGPQGDDFKLMADVRWQERLNGKLREVEKQGAKVVLGMGSLLSPGQIAQLARETGTPGWQKTR
jgi:hypothetical protein